MFKGPAIINGLPPETACIARVHAEEAVSYLISVHTTATGKLQTPFKVYGQVEDPLGQPARGPVILAQYQAEDGTLGEPMARLVDKWGYWTMSLPIDGYEGLTLVLQVIGTDGSTIAVEQAACTSQPSPTMQLAGIPVFRLFLPLIRSH